MDSNIAHRTSDFEFFSKLLEALKGRFWTWLFDEEHGHRRPKPIPYFALGAIVGSAVSDLSYYFDVALGLLMIVVFVAACLIPVAYLIEWLLRAVVESR